MPRGIKIGITVVGIVAVLPIVAMVVLVRRHVAVQAVADRSSGNRPGESRQFNHRRKTSVVGANTVFPSAPDTVRRDRLRSNGLGMCQTELSRRFISPDRWSW